jgi:hypothetical protein
MTSLAVTCVFGRSRYTAKVKPNVTVVEIGAPRRSARPLLQQPGGVLVEERLRRRGGDQQDEHEREPAPDEREDEELLAHERPVGTP